MQKQYNKLQCKLAMFNLSTKDEENLIKIIEHEIKRECALQEDSLLKAEVNLLKEINKTLTQAL